jgi:hypothetical protein
VIKKLLAVAVVAAVAKVVLDKLTKSDKESDLWAEATDSVH